jgi:hypothetical protein
MHQTHAVDCSRCHDLLNQVMIAASVLLLKYLDLSGGIGYPGSAYAKTGRRVECNCSG